jgi:uncharacterized membrane protein YhaH (DUF805 family)
VSQESQRDDEARKTAALGQVDSRTRERLGQVLLFLVAAAVAVLLYQPLLVGPLLLLESFPDQPLLCSLILLLFGLVCFLCVEGSKVRSYKSVYFGSRGLLSLFSMMAGLLSAELFSVGIVGVGGSESPESQASPQDYLALIGGLVLVFLGAAGFKHALDLRVRYWIVLLVTAVVVLLAVLFPQLQP